MPITDRLHADQDPILFCSLTEERSKAITDMAASIKRSAAEAANMTEQELMDTGLFGAAVERLRGITAATTEKKKQFMRDVLDHMVQVGKVASWEFAGSGERYDYELSMSNGRKSIIETKGCLDGNNTNIYQRPPQAEEFSIWSLCQNAGADPRHNVWSGIHTRLSAEIISGREKVDAVIVWDMLCGTLGRPCPKLLLDQNRATNMNTVSGIRTVPPPCIYLFPKTQLDGA